jgi:hypothetical protein
MGIFHHKCGFLAKKPAIPLRLGIRDDLSEGMAMASENARIWARGLLGKYQRARGQYCLFLETPCDGLGAGAALIGRQGAAPARLFSFLFLTVAKHRSELTIPRVVAAGFSLRCESQAEACGYIVASGTKHRFVVERRPNLQYDPYGPFQRRHDSLIAI